MPYRNLSFLALLLTFSISVTAQGRPGGGGSRGAGGGNPTNIPTTSNPKIPNNPPTPSRSGPMFLSGKVVVDDGTPLTDSVAIQSICPGGQTRTEAYTDTKGSFAFQVNGVGELPGIEDTAGAITGAQSNLGGSQNGGSFTRGSQRNLWQCELQAVLPGFTSQVLELSSKATDFGSADVGRIVLHRLGQVEGFTISATSALAPNNARKDYEKGREDEKKGKWDAAAQKFSKAVEVYPKYAAAWFELGRMQLQRNDATSAKNSFRQALIADPKFVSPYQELAEIALRGQQWSNLADATDQVLKLNAVSFPQDWFYNAVANYNLHSLDKAEKSVRQGLNVDARHQFPRMEYLLGVILAGKGDYPGALEHIRNYVKLSPQAPDLSTVEKQIAELEQRSASATPPK